MVKREDVTVYKVVINHEEQYSIWLDGKRNLPGWKDVGVTGTLLECTRHIKRVWTDMRPASLRKMVDEKAKQRAKG